MKKCVCFVKRLRPELDLGQRAIHFVFSDEESGGLRRQSERETDRVY